jgi:hypothetical protein
MRSITSWCALQDRRAWPPFRDRELADAPGQLAAAGAVPFEVAGTSRLFSSKRVLAEFLRPGCRLRAHHESSFPAPIRPRGAQVELHAGQGRQRRCGVGGRCPCRRQAAPEIESMRGRLTATQVAFGQAGIAMSPMASRPRVMTARSFSWRRTSCRRRRPSASIRACPAPGAGAAPAPPGTLLAAAGALPHRPGAGWRVGFRRRLALESSGSWPRWPIC